MTEAGSILDLGVGGKYYDASYEVGLTTELVYQHSTYDYLTLKDSVSGKLSTQANTPPTISALQGCLKTIKARFDSLYSTSRDATLYRQDYEYASTLLQDIKDRVDSGDTTGLHDQVQDFLNVYYQRGYKPYVNTNSEILPYATGVAIPVSVQSALDGKSNTGHTHDDRYYTEGETDVLLQGKANTTHTHDDRYYTEGEVDTLLTGKAAATHGHAISEVNGLQTALDSKLAATLVTTDPTSSSDTLVMSSSAVQDGFMRKETVATYAAMTASISLDSTTKRDFFVGADETNGGVATSYRYDGVLLNRIPSGKGYLPKGIPGIIAAWDYRDVQLNGSKVTQLNDMSGNGYHLTQAVDASRWTIANDGIYPPSSNNIGYDLVKNLTVNFTSATIICIMPFKSLPQHYGPGILFLNSLSEGGMNHNNGASAITWYNPDRYAGVLHNEQVNSLAVAFGSSDARVWSNYDSSILAANAAGSSSVLSKWFTWSTNASFSAWRIPVTACLVYNRQLTEYEIIQVLNHYSVSKKRETALQFVGDSMTGGQNSREKCYTTLVAKAIGGQHINLSQGGNTLDALIGFGTLYYDPLYLEGHKNILTLFIGTNDIAANIATLQTNYQTFCTARKTSHPDWKIVACTILPRNATFSGGQTAAGFETARNTFNTWLRANYRTFADELADFAANTTIGDAADADNLTYYSDKIHPTEAAYAIMATILQNAINRLNDQFTKLTTAQRDALTNIPVGYRAFITDATATDASTGVLQTYNGSTWKNAW